MNDDAISRLSALLQAVKTNQTLTIFEAKEGEKVEYSPETCRKALEEITGDQTTRTITHHLKSIKKGRGMTPQTNRTIEQLNDEDIEAYLDAIGMYHQKLLEDWIARHTNNDTNELTELGTLTVYDNDKGEFIVKDALIDDYQTRGGELRLDISLNESEPK